MDDESKEEIYVIPHNYTDGGGVFRGMFRLRNVIEGVIMAFITGFPIYKWLPMPDYIKLIMIPVLSGGLLIFGCAGINNEAVSANVLYMFKFLLSRRRLVYEKVRSDGANDEAGKGSAGKRSPPNTTRKGQQQ